MPRRYAPRNDKLIFVIALGDYQGWALAYFSEELQRGLVAVRSPHGDELRKQHAAEDTTRADHLEGGRMTGPKPAGHAAKERLADLKQRDPAGRQALEHPGLDHERER